MLGEGIEYCDNDLDRCPGTCTRAFGSAQPFRMEHRLRRNAGECCWIGNTDMLRSSADTLPTGYISSCIDVTDSKRARKKLCLLGHLITTEEDRRGAWVVNSRRISVNALLFWLSNCKIVPAIHRLEETR